MRAFDAILNGKTIDTVFYADSDPIKAEDVYRSLVNHDGYDARIVVREQRPKRSGNSATRTTE